MDDKYNGCNVVESVVSSKAQNAPVKRKKPGTGLLLRLIISVAIIGILLVVHYYTLPEWFNGVTQVLRKVFLYDAFGNTEFGIMAAAIG